MQKVLIADNSEEFSSHLIQLLGRGFQIQVCRDGVSTWNTINQWKPDILVIDLSLPETDGITVLQNVEHRPGLILATTSFCSPYVRQCAKDAGVGYLMLQPCRVQAVYARLMDMIRQQDRLQFEDPQQIVARHLENIKITVTLDGYHQLRVGLPLYAQDPGQTLSKEFYPAVAALCDISDGRSVERSIRSAIDKAFSERNETVWNQYFPPNAKGHSHRPTNKEFLRRMAQILTQVGSK